MDMSEKILTLMEGLRKNKRTIKLNDFTLTASVEVIQFANGPKLRFIVNNGNLEYQLHCSNGLLVSDNGEFKFSMSRFYFSLLREVNSEIRRLSDLINNTL